MKNLICLFAILVWTSISVAQNNIIYDIDSNVYHSVIIKNQTWLKKNLKVSRYNNGNKILTSKTFDFTIEEVTEPKYQ